MVRASGHITQVQTPGLPFSSPGSLSECPKLSGPQHPHREVGGGGVVPSATPPPHRIALGMESHCRVVPTALACGGAQRAREQVLLASLLCGWGN